MYFKNCTVPIQADPKDRIEYLELKWGTCLGVLQMDGALSKIARSEV